MEDNLDDGDDEEVESTYKVVPLEGFIEEWEAYTEMVEEKGKMSLQMLMKKAVPELIEENKFRIKVATETLKETFKAEQIYLVDKFSKVFGTTQFEIHLEVEELPEDEQAKFLTTPKEKYDYMVKVNPKLRDFMDELGLDFEY